MACCAQAQNEKNGFADAQAALQNGEADKALNLLNSLPATAEAHNLRCRVQLTLEHWDAAASECEQATKLDGQNSDYHMWLGRALGERADRASFMSAYSLGKRVRMEFETAVRLNPGNADALADLGEFYNAAPGVVGGGVDKAESVAVQLDRVDQARAHQLRMQVAEGRKDYAAAEAEMKKAVSADPHPAFSWMSLASFYRRMKRWTDLDAAIQSGIKAAQRDKRSGTALYNGASVLIRANRNLPLAATLLDDYLRGSSKTEEAPAFAAYTRLARIKAQQGDKASAWQERSAALALAHDYKPAEELKF